MTKEFICMQETISDTQKKIRTWESIGYTIEIVAQTALTVGVHVSIITSLYRSK